MSTIKSSSENLTLNADGANNDIIFQSNGTTKATLDQAGLLTATSFAGSGANLTGISSFNPDGAVTINESGADVDFRVESDGLTHALFVEGGNGRIGINTGSPVYPFHLVGDRLMTEVVDNSNTGIFMRVKNGSSQVGNSTIRTDNNGDITIFQGTTSEAVRLRFKQAGGICFNGDTAAANALDDYEEGTWTATIHGASVSGGTLLGYYTKIGNLVHASVYVQTTFSNVSGTANMSGLPYSMANLNHNYGVASYVHGSAATGVQNFYLDYSNNRLYPIGTNAVSTVSWQAGSKALMLSMTYRSV